MNRFISGKYKGQTFYEVGRKDYEYLTKWLKTDIKKETKDYIYSVMKGLDSDKDLDF